MDKDTFGDRMKEYEKQYEGMLNPETPFVVRLDGHKFSKFTKEWAKKPFDSTMTRSMVSVTKKLVQHFHAVSGYTQSDEITLVFAKPGEDSEHMFKGRVQKLSSVLSGFTSTVFYTELSKEMDLKDVYPHFDCRVFSVSNAVEATNAVLWRAQDCRKNAIQAIGQSVFSHKKLQHKNQADIVSMLRNEGIKLEDYPEGNINGFLVKRKQVLKEVEIDGRQLEVLRTIVDVQDTGYLGNRADRVERIMEKYATK